MLWNSFTCKEIFKFMKNTHPKNSSKNTPCKLNPKTAAVQNFTMFGSFVPSLKRPDFYLTNFSPLCCRVILCVTMTILCKFLGEYKGDNLVTKSESDFVPEKLCANVIYVIPPKNCTT